MLFLKISNFQSLDEEIESLFLIEIKTDNNTMGEKHKCFSPTLDLYKLRYSSNPILDVEIIKLNNVELGNVLKRLNKMIIKKEFPNYILKEIINFKNYLISNFFHSETKASSNNISSNV